MDQRTEYRNDSPGVAGAVVIENGKPRGIPVAPGDTVWLTEEDKIATANAPKKDSDNPLINGTFTLVTEPQDIANRRPLGPGDEPPSAVPSEEPPAEPVDPEAVAQKQAEEKAAVEAEEKAKAEEAAKAAAPEEAPPAPPAEDVEATAKAKAEEDAKRAERAKVQAQAGAKPTDETGAPVPAQGLPHQGSRKSGEEVASPAAPEKAGTKSG